MSERVVVPGEVIDKNRRKRGDNIEVTERGVISTRLGVLQRDGRRIDVIPYSGPYRPKKGDLVIGIVTGYAPNGWVVDIGAGVKAFLPAAEAFKGRFDPKIHNLREFLRIGDVLVAKVSSADRLGTLLLTVKDKRNSLGKLSTPWFIYVPVVKIARVIGKRGSMLRLIEEATKSKVIVAQNGILAVEGDYEAYLKVKQAIKLISEKTFSRGLTEMVSKLLGGGDKVG